MRIYYAVEAEGLRHHVRSALGWTPGPGTVSTGGYTNGAGAWNPATASPPILDCAPTNWLPFRSPAPAVATRNRRTAMERR